MHDEETRRKALEWLDTSPKVRLPKFKQQLCDELGISKPTLDTWDKERKGKDRMDKVIDQLADLSEDEKSRFRHRVHERAMEQGSSAKLMELNAKLFGMLVEKSEVKVKLSANADELARIDTEAERRTRDFGEQDRAPSLQEKPPILLREIREDTRQVPRSNTS